MKTTLSGTISPGVTHTTNPGTLLTPWYSPEDAARMKKPFGCYLTSHLSTLIQLIGKGLNCRNTTPHNQLGHIFDT